MAALLGAIPALLGGLSGLANKRPPSLDPAQSGALGSLIPSLLPTATGTPHIDPTLQALSYNNIAANQTGGMNAATNALVSHGLGHSGLLGNALTQVVNQGQQSRNASDMNLQNQAIQQKQLSIQDLLQSLNINDTPGQSSFGAFMGGLAPVAAYSIQNMMNNRSSMPAPTGPGFGIDQGTLPFGPGFGAGF